MIGAARREPATSLPSPAWLQQPVRGLGTTASEAAS